MPCVSGAAVDEKRLKVTCKCYTGNHSAWEEIRIIDEYRCLVEYSWPFYSGRFNCTNSGQ